MILLYHPKSTRPRSRRFPLSVLSLAAVLEGKRDYCIVDGNVESDPLTQLSNLATAGKAKLLAVSVMPGPQMVAALDTSRAFRRRHPAVPIVWGGYFPSLYPDATLNAPYVDFAVRGQGEETFLELVEALDTGSGFETIRGLSFKSESQHYHNPARGMKHPDAFPWLPYHRVNAEKYILPTFLGTRTAVHQASIGCPYRCNFCGVIPTYGNQQEMESPERTEAILRHLVRSYGVNAIQFYDNNFFLREDHARELCDRLAPLRLNWWCEARIDRVLRYSHRTLESIRRAGCRMIFFGAESGSDWVLKAMNKQLTSAQTLELAERIREFGIIPEFSFVVGNPQDPERDTRECLSFIRKIKRINSDAEIIVQHYTPVPQRDKMYGNVEDRIAFPTTPEEWASERWLNFTLRISPRVSWLPERVKVLIDNFELVVNSRWPTAQDIRLPNWGRWLLKVLSSWRYRFAIYTYPVELDWAQRWINLRKPKVESL
ncbi:MAG: radical SAM protein [Acidobacteriota bacterium]